MLDRIIGWYVLLFCLAGAVIAVVEFRRDPQADCIAQGGRWVAWSVGNDMLGASGHRCATSAGLSEGSRT